MELRHLRYFVAVAEEMSFTRAARRLHIAQPPLSQQIRDLEEELGLLLFDRGGRTIALTQAGREILPEARAILESATELQRKATLRARGDVGSLTIGVISSMAVQKFATMLRDFQKINPGIRVSLIDHPSTRQMDELASGGIDVGFLIPPEKPPRTIAFRRIRKAPMKLAAPSDHPLAKKPRVEWRDLADEPLILVEVASNGPGYYDEFLLRCRAEGFEPRIEQYTMNIATQLWRVSAGLGLAPMLVTPDMDQPPGVAFLDLPADAPVYEAAMAWRQSETSAVVMKFVEFVAASAGGTGE